MLALVLTACGDDVTQGATTSAPPTPATTAAPTTTATPATDPTDTDAPTTTAHAASPIDLAAVIGAVRPADAVLADFTIGTGDGALGLEVPNESAGRGPANPVLLSDGTVVVSDGVNERFVILPASGEASVSPSPLITADCAATGPDDVVYVASAAMLDPGISAFAVAAGDAGDAGEAGVVSRVAGPSGGGAAESPSMGGPGDVPAFVDGAAVAPGTAALPLVDASGAPLAELPPETVISVERGEPSVADGIAYTVTRTTGGTAVGTWEFVLPVIADAPWGPSLLWAKELGADGLVAVWDTEVDGAVVFVVARVDGSGLADGFTIPSTWRIEGPECTNPAADDERLVALVPDTASGSPGDATTGFRLLEWRWTD